MLSQARSLLAIARRKKRRPKAPFLKLPAGSEHVLYPKPVRGHVRARAVTTGRPVAVVSRRASDVVVGRADRVSVAESPLAVVDLVVGNVHLGALRQHVVIAQGVHLRLQAADRGAYGVCRSGGHSATLGIRTRIAAPYCAGSGVPPAVHDVSRHLHARVRGVAGSVVPVGDAFEARSDLTRPEIPFRADLHPGVLRVRLSTGDGTRTKSL